METMLRMYLLQVWFHLSDEGEHNVNDSFAVAQFMRLDFGRGQQARDGGRRGKHTGPRGN